MSIGGPHEVLPSHGRDRDQRWFEYDRIEPSVELADLLEEVNADPAGIFWG